MFRLKQETFCSPDIESRANRIDRLGFILLAIWNYNTDNNQRYNSYRKENTNK